MTYETLAAFAQTGGLIYFVLIFAAVVAYALWPSNLAGFQRAARLPMSEKESGDDRPLP
jgi:cytochrome c oxidase cbb3-type subunit IV